MPSTVNWINPYADRQGEWLRGNLHTHTSPASACGSQPAAEVIDLYWQRGYQFLSVSDHMALSVIAESRGMTWIPGIEWNSEAGEHTGIFTADRALLSEMIGIKVHDDVLKRLSGTDALVILNHPNWQAVPHYSREALHQKIPYDGIEIFNAVIGRLVGNPDSTDKWDHLLSQGRRVLGFASDDSHRADDIGRAWLCVRAAKRTPEAIIRAIKQGNFYCSSGVGFSDIRRDEAAICVESDNAGEITATGAEGREIKTVKDRAMTLDLAGLDSPYVRFTARGSAGITGWTQPFFLK
jgi:predicted metal-dependent phosphoesterase TrpH